MAWRVKVGDSWRYVDDLTVAEMEAIEAASGQAWGLFNPLLSMKSAAATLAAFMVRDGASNDDAKKAVDKLTHRNVKNVFEYHDDDDLPSDWEDGLPVVDPKAPSEGPSTAG